MSIQADVWMLFGDKHCRIIESSYCDDESLISAYIGKSSFKLNQNKIFQCMKLNH